MTKEQIDQLLKLFTKDQIKKAHGIMKNKPIFTLRLVKQVERNEIIEAFLGEEFESIAKTAKRHKIPKRTMYRITEFARKKIMPKLVFFGTVFFFTLLS